MELLALLLSIVSLSLSLFVAYRQWKLERSISNFARHYVHQLSVAKKFLAVVTAGFLTAAIFRKKGGDQ